MKPLKKSNKGNTSTAYAKYSGIALQMLVIIGVGTFIGVQLDNYFETNSNGFTAGLSLFSVLVAIFYVVRQIIQISKKNDH